MKRTTRVLLSVIALAVVVIAVNMTSKKAEAQAQPQVGTTPRIVDIGGHDHLMVRVWNTGALDVMWGQVNPGTCNACPTSDPINLWTPMGFGPDINASPTAVIITRTHFIFLVYSDNSVWRREMDYLTADECPGVGGGLQECRFQWIDLSWIETEESP